MDYTNAINSFRAARNLRPEDVNIRIDLAKAYSVSGLYDDASTLLTEVIKTNQKSWDAYIELARVLVVSGDTDGALGYLLTVQQNVPNYRKAEVDMLMAGL